MNYRIYKYDNIKAILIFCVVYCHLITILPSQGDIMPVIYKIIYTFHMPVFIFLSGFFAKPHKRDSILNFFAIYLIFQAIYLIQDSLVYVKEVKMQFTTPTWMMWYLLTLAMYYLVLPLFETNDIQKQIFLIGLVIVISLLTGYETTIGTYLSLSRFFSFLPYFLFGYYCQKNHWEEKITRSRWLPIISILGCFLGILFVSQQSITKKMLFGDSSYAAANYTPLVKFLFLLFATCWLIFFLIYTPRKEIPFLTVLGKNTFPIYCFHGFIVRVIDSNNILQYDLTVNCILLFLFSIAIITVFGNNLVANLFKKIFGYSKS